MNCINTVCIYCASSAKVGRAYFDAAHQLGALLAERGVRIVTGAGNIGLMRAVEDAALQHGGQVTGVIPRFMVDEGWCHPGLSEIIVTEEMHTRKRQMMEMSDAAIALPGGCGTIEELAEAITWRQLGLCTAPLVILNTNDYYHHLLAQLRQAVDEHFMGEIHATLWQVADTPQEAVELLYTTPQWSDNPRRHAAIK